MKIIKIGEKPSKVFPAWVGKKYKCPACNGIFELEEEDYRKWETSYRNKKFWMCPTDGCNEIHYLRLETGTIRDFRNNVIGIKE